MGVFLVDVVLFCFFLVSGTKSRASCMLLALTSDLYLPPSPWPAALSFETRSLTGPRTHQVASLAGQ